MTKISYKKIGMVKIITTNIYEKMKDKIEILLGKNCDKIWDKKRKANREKQIL